MQITIRTGQGACSQADAHPDGSKSPLWPNTRPLSPKCGKRNLNLQRRKRRTDSKAATSASILLTRGTSMGVSDDTQYGQQLFGLDFHLIITLISQGICQGWLRPNCIHSEQRSLKAPIAQCLPSAQLPDESEQRHLLKPEERYRVPTEPSFHPFQEASSCNYWPRGAVCGFLQLPVLSLFTWQGANRNVTQNPALGHSTDYNIRLLQNQSCKMEYQKVDPSAKVFRNYA